MLISIICICICICIALAGGLALAAYGQTGQAKKGGRAQQNVVDASGNLRVPADYRTRYQFLGTWALRLTQARARRRFVPSMHRRAR